MTVFVDLPYYLAYSVAGASSAGLAKASMHAAQRREWRRALVRLLAGGAAIAINLAIMLVLLGRTDMSVMAPLAIGLNLVVATAIALVVFRERIDRSKAIGMALIGLGVALLVVAA